jgi:hypothetical protein
MGELMLSTIRETYPDDVVREVLRQHSFSFRYYGEKYHLRHEQGMVMVDSPEEADADVNTIIQAILDLGEKMEQFDDLTMLEFACKYAKMQLDMSRKLARGGGAKYEVIETHPLDKTKLSLEEQCLFELLQEQPDEVESTGPTTNVITKEMVNARVAQKKRDIAEKAKKIMTVA